MGTRIRIIADDLTGALDTGVQLAGLGAQIGFTGTTDPAAPVSVVDTESRHLEPATARQRVRDAVRAERGFAVNPSPDLIFYKKTDSTLRGNLGAEFSGLLDAVPGRPLLFVPAYPKLGRTTSAGIHYVEGLPVAESAFGRDPRNPVPSSRVAELIGGPTGIPVVTLPLGRPLSPALRAAGPGGVVAADAIDDADLERLAAEVAALGPAARPLLAGCAGFAAYLPGISGLAARPLRRTVPTGPFLVVRGSLNPVALKQAARAVEAGVPSVRLDPAEVFGDIAVEARCGEIAAALESAGSCLLWTAGRQEDVGEYRAAGVIGGVPAGGVFEAVAKATGRLVARVLERTKVGTLVVFGGDTLFGILSALTVGSIRPEYEVSSGVVAARLSGRTNPSMLITKAGGFGGPDLVESLMRPRD